MITVRLCIATGIACMAAGIPAWAQANSATFYGSVVDPTGAAVPDAVVSMTATDTGAAISKTTVETGEFAFSFVPAGTYTLRINAKGFKTYAASGFTLTAGQQVRQTFPLELGSVTDTVLVGWLASMAAKVG